ncbi:MAG: hypothetical protein IKX02_02685 [Spirochaetales bacterium]|nr:hypothetical protein [Spirochaetales bacterium]
MARAVYRSHSLQRWKGELQSRLSPAFAMKRQPLEHSCGKRKRCVFIRRVESKIRADMRWRWEPGQRTGLAILSRRSSAMFSPPWKKKKVSLFKK